MFPVLPTATLIRFAFFGLASADFSFFEFPRCAQEYLYQNAPAACDYGNLVQSQVDETNRCLCASAEFLKGTAQDVGAHCSCEELQETVDTITVAGCGSVSVKPVYDSQQLIGFGNSNQSCSATSTPVSTDKEPPSSKGLGSGAIAGIVVGSIAGAVLVVAFSFWVWLYSRGRQRRNKNGSQELIAAHDGSPRNDQQPQVDESENEDFGTVSSLSFGMRTLYPRTGAASQSSRHPSELAVDDIAPGAR